MTTLDHPGYLGQCGPILAILDHFGTRWPQYLFSQHNPRSFANIFFATRCIVFFATWFQDLLCGDEEDMSCKRNFRT